METDFKKSIFYRSLMTAVFVGIFATLLTMFYDLAFVEMRHFPLSSIINVASLIFSVNFVFMVIGFVYYVFLRALKKGNVFFMIVIILLTVFLVWKAEAVNRTDDQAINSEFRSLLAGIIIIIGLLASFVVPFLYHNKKFEKYVL